MGADGKNTALRAAAKNRFVEVVPGLMDRDGKTLVLRAAAANKFLEVLAVGLWLGGFHFVLICAFAPFLFLPIRWAFTGLSLLLLSLAIPLYEDTRLAKLLAKFIFTYATSYFPMTLVVEDSNAFDSNQTYIFAVAPHSIIPVGLLAFCNGIGGLPFANLKILASSAIFFTPIVRHIWTWLGLIPVSMKILLKRLEAGKSCILVPGGVREMLVTNRDHEVAFLSQRYGFVRAAIKTGSHLVPTFIFGQGYAYKWWKPSGKFYSRFSRTAGFTPLIFWGSFGSAIPYRHPVYVAVGKPIEVTKNVEPSYEEVEAVHAKFVSSLQELFDKHKVAAGYADTVLHVC
eukprot:c15794_g1_i1 orf=208-1236(+)